MKNSRKRCLAVLASFWLMLCALTALAEGPKPAPRQVQLDLAKATNPLDRFFDLSVGSDFPGTLIREDSQAVENSR